MRDGLKLVSATADGITLTNGKITVPVTKAYHSVGTVEVKFTEKAKIKSVKVGATDYTTEITTKFGNDKAIFTADVVTTFVDLVSKGTEVTVVVEGEDGVEKTFTIQLVVDSLVTVEKLVPTIENILPGAYAVSVDESEVKKIFNITDTTKKLQFEIDGEPVILSHEDGLGWANGNVAAESEDVIKKAVVIVK